MGSAPRARTTPRLRWAAARTQSADHFTSRFDGQPGPHGPRIVAALLVLEGAGLEGDTSGATDAAVVRAKLERLLPGSLRRRAVATATATHVLTSGLEPVDARLHGLLVDTAAHRGIVHFSHSDGDGRVCDRQVQPLTCFIHEGRWYLLGHDLHRRDWRVFRLDRITSATADPAVTGRSPLTFPEESE